MFQIRAVDVFELGYAKIAEILRLLGIAPLCLAKRLKIEPWT